MQTANIFLALGGNAGHTIQKFGVTPAEIAVLREIHGEASVFDVEPDEDVQRSSREERSRLLGIYGKPPGSREMSAVEALFPGAAARLFETLDELELDPSFYKATSRAAPKAKAKAPEPDEVDEQEPATTDEPEPAPKPKKTTAAARTTKPVKKSGKSLFK